MGCSTISSYVEGWPKLTVTVHDSNLVEINKKCWPYMPTFAKLTGSIALACTTVNFSENRCDIYLMPHTPQFIVDHEFAHCNGGDHSDHSMEKYYDRWLDAHKEISNHYDKVPPKLIRDSSGTSYWDHSSKFGFIPLELVPEGKKFCEELNNDKKTTYKAIGWHKYAQNVDGKNFVGGGYFCVSE
jgi:hypothetical protein